MRRRARVENLPVAAWIVEEPLVSTVIDRENPPATEGIRQPNQIATRLTRLDVTKEPADDVCVGGPGLVRVEDVS